MAEARIQENPINELNLNFFVRLVKVRTSLMNFYRLDISIKDPSGNEIKREILHPGEYEFDDVLNMIKKLYDALKMGTASNEKLVAGAREEILSLMAILILKIY